MPSARRSRRRSPPPTASSGPAATVAEVRAARTCRRRMTERSLAVSELSPDYFHKPVADVDPEIAQVIADETNRQETTLEMIASENFVPQAVLDSQGSVLTNKYAEGYPGRRYYGGREVVDGGGGAGAAAGKGGVWGGPPETPPPAPAAGGNTRS